MSGGITAMQVMAAAAVAGTAVSIKNGMDQKDAQNKAQKQAQANANKSASDADQANNKANQKQPDTMSILDAANQAGKSGVSGTMLTGAQGIDPNALSLGKNTLLGA